MVETLALRVIEDDCGIVLSRALSGKHVVAFGEDGCGKYGRSSMPRTFKITGVDVEISGTSASPTGIVFVALDVYDSKTDGHVATDKNLEISLNFLLDSWAIEHDCLKFAPEDQQGDKFFTMIIDIPKLLLW